MDDQNLLPALILGAAVCFLVAWLRGVAVRYLARHLLPADPRFQLAARRVGAGMSTYRLFKTASMLWLVRWMGRGDR